MPDSQIKLKQVHSLSPHTILIWRFVQAIVWLAGAAILFCLLFYPSAGLLLFWNILIPVAPALLVVFTGLWRNICPLATTNLIPRHLGLSKRKKLSQKQAGRLSLIAVIALYAIVPLRHALFNNNGLATATLILFMVIAGMGVGFVYEWKSAWCSGLCPVHPVEKLYGGNVLMTIPNANCDKCMNCVVPCPDSTPNISPGSSSKTIYHRLSNMLITGGLPGFIWGWFHVPDQKMITSFGTFIGVYQMPLMGFAVTLAIYVLLSAIIQHRFERKLTGFFAACGVSCYYWFRLPELLGFGKYGRDGLLYDISELLPVDGVYIMTTALSLFFFYWLFVRERNKKSWLIRPEFAKKQGQLKHKLSA